MNLIELEGVYKIYKKGEFAIKNLNFYLENNEFIAVMGPSGSGKSTFLNICYGMTKPSAGKVKIYNKNISNFSEEEITIFRRNNLGCIFQDFRLLDYLNVKDNIILPLTFLNKKNSEMKSKLKFLSEFLNIKDILHKNIFEISGGEKQKVAIARALITEPKVLFADEPTGSLDFKSSDDVMKLMKKIQTRMNTTIFMVTHDPYIASFSNRVIFLRDGEIYNEIYKGENNKQFYREILDVLSFLGGNDYEF